MSDNQTTFSGLFSSADGHDVANVMPEFAYEIDGNMVVGYDITMSRSQRGIIACGIKDANGKIARYTVLMSVETSNMSNADAASEMWNEIVDSCNSAWE